MIEAREVNTTEGMLTYWNAADCDRSTLEAELQMMALHGHLPARRRNISMLKDAVEEFARENKVCTDKFLCSPLTDGVSIVNVKQGESENEFRTMISAWVDEAGVITTNPMHYQSPVFGRFLRLRDVITGPQITHALTKIIDSWHGLRLRENGGLYWLSASRLPAWEALTGAIERSTLQGQTCKVFVIKHPIDEKVLDAMQDAIQREIETETARIKKELESDDLGLRAVKTRQEQTDHLRAKLNSLTSMLGGSLVSLKAMVEETDQAAAVLAMQLMAADNQTVAA